jgi:hypothetical protein
MSFPGPDFTTYSTVLFMDSMVALEARPLRELPWQEIDPNGPILVLLVPQVNTEIDRRKRDGRLAKRAREFNRIIAPAAETASPSRICDGPPVVDIAIAICDRINWDALDDLDPDSGDARVVAQILHARGVPHDKRLLFSHDINPIAMAARHNLRTHKMPDHWLLEPEPSPMEKEAQKLRARIQDFEAAEPTMTALIDFEARSPLTLFDVAPLSLDQQRRMIERIIEENPGVEQRLSPFGAPMLGEFDYSYEEKYERYCTAVVPRHAKDFHRRLETHYNQIPFVLRIENTGRVQAENLVVLLTAIGGTIHNRFRAYPLWGPPEPQPEISPLIPAFRQQNFPETARRHDVEFANPPDGGRSIELNCADFRQGRAYRLNGIALIDVRSENPFRIKAHLTASNLNGQQTSLFQQDFKVTKVKPEDLISLDDAKYRVEIPMMQQFNSALEAKDANWFHFLDNLNDDDDG